jgi:hypothetical protein
MTTEELAAAGLPAEPEVQDHEIAQPPEEHASPAASGSGIHEDGEIRSEGEEIGNVDADVKDLIAAKQSGPLPRSIVFRESKITANLIREYEAAGFFPIGSGHTPLDEQVPTPEADEVVVFRDFLQIEVPLRSHSSCDTRCFFSEDSPAFTKLISRSFPVHLDYEDFRLQLWCRCFRSII